MTVKPGLSVVEPGIRGSMFDFGAGGIGEANVFLRSDCEDGWDQRQHWVEEKRTHR